MTSLSADDGRKVGELTRKLIVSKASLFRFATELPALGNAVKSSS